MSTGGSPLIGRKQNKGVGSDDTPTILARYYYNDYLQRSYCIIEFSFSGSLSADLAESPLSKIKYLLRVGYNKRVWSK